MVFCKPWALLAAVAALVAPMVRADANEPDVKSIPVCGLPHQMFAIGIFDNLTTFFCLSQLRTYSLQSVRPPLLTEQSICHRIPPILSIQKAYRFYV
jgi:hypothetical protein